ncbi:phage tail sheath protein [Brevibacillus laterosporus]|uniref:phage tail sheath family protein n=1 Tax=Brevibacillus laterosporus TaxID=1465 RepID=UPI002405571C|nr:phage tail sheath family protein [Brevibacillus laterosporus]MDF9412963.1 phage tail sheath protein [Brevibacillus laterosporus]
MAGGGEWLTQNKTRPGTYTNVRSEPKPLGAIGDRGIATMALELPWGDSQTIIEITAGENVLNKLGFDITRNEVLLVREALKRAKTLKLWRLNKGTPAKATLGTVTITALHGGTRGNDIRIVVEEDVDEAGTFIVSTFLEGSEVDRQRVKDAKELQENPFVSFAGTGALEVTVGIPLKDGSNGTATNEDHMKYLEQVELQEFNTIGLISENPILKSVYVSFVKRLYADEGKYVQLVLADYSLADTDRVISVKNGVILSDGTKLSNIQAVAWVMGATAGALLNQSLTYQRYDDAVDVNPRYTNSQIIEAIKKGEFVFTFTKGKAVVEYDINSFTNYSPEKRQHFSKNRVIRTLDSIANDSKRIFEDFYLGKVDNDDDGRNLYRKEVIKYLDTMQEIRAIQNFNAQTDIKVVEGEQVDGVYAAMWVQPVDSMEKLYLNVRVK